MTTTDSECLEGWPSSPRSVNPVQDLYCDICLLSMQAWYQRSWSNSCAATGWTTILPKSTPRQFIWPTYLLRSTSTARMLSSRCWSKGQQPRPSSPWWSTASGTVWSVAPSLLLASWLQAASMVVVRGIRKPSFTVCCKVSWKMGGRCRLRCVAWCPQQAAFSRNGWGHLSRISITGLN